MAGEWSVVQLGDIALAENGLVDGPFGSNLPEARFRDEEFVFVSEATARRLNRSLCRPGDIVFTKKGTLGQTGVVPHGSGHDRYLLSSNQMRLAVNREKANPMFIFYSVSSLSNREKIIRDSTVTGVPKTNLAYLREFPILLPPLDEQKAISQVLGSLDDKIELNRKMNETLEAMARVLFKSWFVGFDPVRAKAEGCPTGLPDHISALFPDSFEDSELGEIPRGWRVAPLSETVVIIGGGTPKTSVAYYWGGDIPWFSVVDAPRKSDIWAIDTEKKITQAGVDNSSTRILPVRTTIISARGTVGRVR